MIAKVKNFVRESYEQSLQKAFFCEMAEANTIDKCPCCTNLYCVGFSD